MVAVTSEVNMAGGRPREACRWVSRGRLEKNAAAATRHKELTICSSPAVGTSRMEKPAPQEGKVSWRRRLKTEDSETFTVNPMPTRTTLREATGRVATRCKKEGWHDRLTAAQRQATSLINRLLFMTKPSLHGHDSTKKCPAVTAPLLCPSKSLAPLASKSWKRKREWDRLTDWHCGGSRPLILHEVQKGIDEVKSFRDVQLHKDCSINQHIPAAT